MSVYVSKRNESKVEFLETAKKLSAHTLTYCLKAPKRLTFFLTKDICALARRVYYEANTANGILPRNRIETQNRRTHFQLALSACENMEIPLAELFEYIYMYDLKKIKDAINFIEKIVQLKIHNEDVDKNIVQKILEENEKVIKLNDDIYAYKE